MRDPTGQLKVLANSSKLTSGAVTRTEAGLCTSVRILSLAASGRNLEHQVCPNEMKNICSLVNSSKILASLPCFFSYSFQALKEAVNVRKQNETRYS